MRKDVGTLRVSMHSLLRGVCGFRSLQSAQDGCQAGDGACCPSKEDDRFMEKLDTEVHRVNRYLRHSSTCLHACIPQNEHQGRSKGSFMQAHGGDREAQT